MGLDMYLMARRPSDTPNAEVAYWRKANGIHRWFVSNVQKGVDDCGHYDVSREQLESLVLLCQRVHDDPKLAAELLPTQGGFFFGSTDYDTWYRMQLESTISQVSLALEDKANTEFFYHSSW